ncbi:uncharacterized protein LOC133469140 isoform X4 [Phyllopteryx taeniolatus]|nr:uncharacterized protein LOC133469140 isoform X4 [Phyllopteryx taeniolatus]
MCTAILHQEKKAKMHYQMAVIINFLGHAISMLALLVAFFLFLCLRSIRCLRNIIHWNLISAFILRNATWFVVQLTMSPQVHESNVVWCRLVTASFNYFHSTNFFWMFGEGCYLHTAIVLTYSTDKLRKWMFICIGWCIPLPIIVAWAVGKLYYDNEKCWFGKRAGVYTDYIYQGPMILVLVDPDDQTASVHHLRDHSVQESGEGHVGAPPPSGDHLHAILCQSRRGRDLAAGLHLLQLLPGILPGALGRQEALPPLAGAALHPGPDDPGHVHPHVALAGQLPQHQTVHVAMKTRRPLRPPGAFDELGRLREQKMPALDLERECECGARSRPPSSLRDLAAQRDGTAARHRLSGNFQHIPRFLPKSFSRLEHVHAVCLGSHGNVGK